MGRNEEELLRTRQDAGPIGAVGQIERPSSRGVGRRRRTLIGALTVGAVALSGFLWVTPDGGTSARTDRLPSATSTSTTALPLRPGTTAQTTVQAAAAASATSEGSASSPSSDTADAGEVVGAGAANDNTASSAPDTTPSPRSLRGRVVFQLTAPPAGVWSVNLDGSDRRLEIAADSDLVYPGTPDVSRDGRWISYVWHMDSCVCSAGEVHLRDVETGIDRVIVPYQVGLLQFPRYSPDGGRVSFTYRNELWIVNVDGSGLQRVELGSERLVRSASWAPDGHRLLVEMEYSPDQYAWMLDLDTGAFDPFGGIRPSGGAELYDTMWSPCDERIAFDEYDPNAGLGIGLINAATGERTTLVTPRPDVRGAPTWTPDCTAILFNVLNTATGHVEIWSVTIADSTERVVTGGYNDASPQM
jgi:hypothetical protein